MPSVSRTRVIAASQERVWELLSDPHHSPRWWPRALRVEDVRGEGQRAQWTLVLGTERGTGVRVDYRCSASTRPRRLVWEQQLAGTPFERILKGATIEADLQPAGGEETEVTLRSDEALRGLSRLGAPMLRRATRRRLDETLDGIEGALVERGTVDDG
jgi:uncharacterized protein YndB with AHSA1/START domain